ncbi:MAG: CocE/NonD family hydrolase [Devosiaceae bacterium]|nr:CocE/NonD family hydrolase [Devosiaceae bacterium]
MSFASKFFAWRNKIKPATHRVKKSADNIVTSFDNTKLLTDIYFPQGTSSGNNAPFPTILIRTAYKRAGFANYARIYAERGFITVLQACRGTDGSGGEIGPLLLEREDGLATLEWLKKQDWFDGRLGMSGPSYLGYVQWAICDSMPEKSAIATQIATTEYQNVLFPQGATNLQFWLSWMQLNEGLASSPLKFMFGVISGKIERNTKSAANTTPLIDADIAAAGHKVDFWRRWMLSEVKRPEHWQQLSQSGRIDKNTPPNSFVSGWYDFIIDELIDDYNRLRKNGHNPYLTIGPWTHVDPKLIAQSVHDTLAWMKAKLKDDASDLREKPVRIFIPGLNKWREYESYPPPGAKETTLYLEPENSLFSKPVETAEPAKFTYDPNDPTPNLGGAIFAFTGAGAFDNRPLEARDDVLTFTSEPLNEAKTLIGQPKVKLFAKSSLEHTDFVARLCDVHPNGKSINICDGFVRITPKNNKKLPDGCWEIDIVLHNSAHQFAPGHQLRLQICSGAHPKISRNPGVEEEVDKIPDFLVAQQSIFFDKKRPSSINLPLYDL